MDLSLTYFYSDNRAHHPSPLTRNMSEITIECNENNGIPGQLTSIYPYSSEPDKLQQRIMAAFDLPPTETIIDEFPCYFIRLVTLPGWMYITRQFICFYAPLPGKNKGPYKAGYLSKKNHLTSPRLHRYYFELQDHVLSWYESAESKYAPLGSIDLKWVTTIDTCKLKNNGIKLTINQHHRYHFIADSDISQKEWLDEIRKAVFMAQQSGRSVRIVLPFSKITDIEKPSIFRFAGNIKIRVVDNEEISDQAEDYYFAFFPDINAAYNKITQVWDKADIIPEKITSNDEGGHPSNILANISPAAFPTLIMGKFMNIANMFQFIPSDDGDVLIEQPKKIEDTTSTQRESQDGIYQNRSIHHPSPPLLSPTASPIPHREDNSGYSLIRIPRIVTDAFKSQILRTKDDNTKTIQSTSDSEIQSDSSFLSENSNTTNKSRRRHSFNLSRSYLPSFNLKMAINNRDTLDASSQETTSRDSVGSKTRRDRAKSIGSMILSSSSKRLSKLNPIASRELSADKPHAKDGIWINQDLLTHLRQQSTDNMDILTGLDESDDSLHAPLNEVLNKTFPMLLGSENVEAVIKASIWRTLPYTGKLYVTPHFVCFHSKILAGKQKLIIPWEDVLQVNEPKAKSYLLQYGLGLVLKDMTEELILDFSSNELKEIFYRICLNKKKDLGREKGINRLQKTHTATSFNSILMDRPEHVPPPSGYDGPPVLSHTPSQLVQKSGVPSSLHITFLTIGSRGDVQPYIALSKGLQKKGHRCRIATHTEYKEWVEKHDIEFRSIGGDPGELMKLCIDNSFLSVSFIREGSKFFYKWFEDLLASSYEACKGTDVIIESPSAMVGIHMAEKLEVPYFRSMPFPYSRTTKFPHPFAVQYSNGGRIYNDMTYVMIEIALWTGISRYVNKFRRNTLQLPSTSMERLDIWKIPYLYSFSPTVIHPPKDWPDYVHCTGYWFLDNPDHGWTPPQQLEKLLNATDDTRPIIYIGFGSIIVSDPIETTRIIVESVLESNVRAIICKGWSSRMQQSESDTNSTEDNTSNGLLGDHPESIYHCSSVPHDWLFSRIHGVIHHGGAGTTAAGLRAGLPTVIKPFFGDQRFWGQRVEELQVGVCINKLNKQQLCDAIATITEDDTIIAKARAVGETIREENGVEEAIQCIFRDLSYAKQLRVPTKDIIPDE
ncbi:hypothetical protein BDB01DRAFT_800156 [Pilobolus umbonatus]|nr:hypothetical protein BDB01DRAFT_800156 [Pilobolus umbonatus]